jgi:hypothetical protein
MVMAGIRERVAEKKARGLYAVDALATPPEQRDPIEPERIEQLQMAASVSQRLVVTRSTKSGLGPFVTRMKWWSVRANADNVEALARDVSAFNAQVTSYVATLGQHVARLQEAVYGTSGHPAALPEGPPDLAALMGRPGRAIVLSAGEDLRRAATAAAGEVVDGWPGADAGPDAVVAALAAHAAAAAGAVVLDVLELLDGRSAATLVHHAAAALAPGGALVALVRNPRSASEMRDRFWRDPARVRPYDPETVAMMMHAAGLGPVRLAWADPAAAEASASCAVVGLR